MERTLQLTTGGRFERPTHPATGALLAAGGLLMHLAARLEQRAKERAKATPLREFVAQELGGQAGGAVFEDGKFVGWLPGVTRL